MKTVKYSHAIAAQPVIRISGFNLTPEEFKKSGKKLVDGGTLLPGWTIFKSLKSVKKAIQKINEKSDPKQKLESVKKLALMYQIFYRDGLAKEQEQFSIDAKYNEMINLEKQILTELKKARKPRKKQKEQKNKIP